MQSTLQVGGARRVSGRRRPLTAGQAPQAAPHRSPQTPTFKVQVDYVDVDVLVTDKDGRFVRDLTKDDFQVFEDGRRQTITNFSVVNIPVDRADRPLYSPETTLEPDVQSNETPFEGRIYVMILDDVHIDVQRTPNVRTPRGSSSSAISAPTT